MGKWRKWPLRFAYAIYVKNEIKKGLSCNFCNERIKEEEEAAENSGFDKVRILQVPLLFGGSGVKIQYSPTIFCFFNNPELPLLPSGLSARPEPVPGARPRLRTR